jgi:uncharacterized protein DUF4330
MTIVDNRGRLFGRINLVDAAVLIFVIVLIPVAYGAFLLFRPAAPRIDSVTQTDLTKEEVRIAGGARLSAKLKVTGTGFTPLLRATIGDQPAMGYVFENPNSADVLVGEVGVGRHDLVLFDGVQEVARATGAVTIQEAVGTIVRTVGRFVALDAATSQAVKPGFASPKDARAAFEVVAVGPARPALSRLAFGDSVVDMPFEGYVERAAVLNVRCDSPGAACAIGGVRLTERAPMTVALAGDLPYEIAEILPTTDPHRGRLQVRFTGPQAAAMKAGDRDLLLDSRAAVLAAMPARDTNGVTATLELGVDSSREGWRYRGQLLRPGAPFRITTDRYEANGLVVSLDVADAPIQPVKTP